MKNKNEHTFQKDEIEKVMHNHFPQGPYVNAQKPSRQMTNGTGVFYCPMHCEGDKTYDKPGNCPVCGMDLVEQPSSKKSSQQYTCPMHPEIIRDEPGACPICGMELVPIVANVEPEDKTYKKLLHKFKIAVTFTAPIFILAMTEMIHNNPIFNLMGLKYWNWVEFALSIPGGFLCNMDVLSTGMALHCNMEFKHVYIDWYWFWCSMDF